MQQLIPIFLGVVLLAHSAPAKQPAPFELLDGDRVVFIGDTLIEREQTHGYVEAALTIRFPDRHVTFRNLGWSADTPQGQSRVSFDWSKSREEWFKQLTNQIAATRPTVVVLGYGMASSFDGRDGLAGFTADMNRLIDAIQQLDSAKKVRFVLLSPIRHETLGAPLPDPKEHNGQLALYTSAIREIAAQRDFVFINLFETVVGKTKPRRPLTDNGIHLNARGYQKLAETVEKGLGWKPSNIQRLAQSAVFETLRQTILHKNELFFHRWRPQNETYLFGFRKHEQGNNAGEIPRFDPLVEAEEQRIAALRQLKAGLPVPEPAPPLLAPINPLQPQPLPHFDVAPGLEVNLFAEHPQIAKPLHMNFDAQGRLWVASSAVYPHILPGQVPTDKIIVLEDRDGDGRAEIATVFADGLLIPTGVEPGDGGVYVGQSTELLHLKDTNGDGRADERRVVLSSFGTEDTHHTLHTLRWGYDGQLYMNQSIYIHTHIETPHGVVRLNSGGIFNFRTPTMELGIHTRGFVNSWGHHYDEFGQYFATDGAGSQGIHYIVPGGMYLTYAGARRILGSVSPGSYPKFCGLEILYSEHFPDDWQGNAITCDFRAQRIVRFSISEKDSAYVTQQMPDVLRSTNITFRPVDVKAGPDGALYIADWSNPIIQHGEVDFRDPRRDQVHGRIWRVTAKDRPLAPKPALVKARNSELLNELLSKNAFNREQARRVLTGRGEKILPDLRKWVAAHAEDAFPLSPRKARVGRGETIEKTASSPRPSEEREQRRAGAIDADLARLQALWIHQALNVVEPHLLEELLNAGDPRIRAAATHVLSFWHDRIADPVKLLEARTQDAHPRVRLLAVRALAKIPGARSAELALDVLNKPMDPFLDYAVWHTINDLSAPWIAAIQSGEWSPQGRERELEFGLSAIEPRDASAVLTLLLANKPLARDGSGKWIELIGRAGAATELDLLFDQALRGGFDDAATVRALSALNDASRLRSVKPSLPRERIAELFVHANENVRVEALRVAGAWKDIKGQFATVVSLAGHTETSAEMRNAAFAAIREIGGRRAIEALAPLADEDKALEIRRPAVLALAALDLTNAAPRAVSLLQSIEHEEEAVAIWRSLLGNKGAAPILARALPAEGFSGTSGKAGLRVAREAGRNEPELVLALTRAANLADAGQDLTEAELKQLGEFVMKDGDAARGELVYRRPELGCVTCHAIGGVGGKVGPDMTSIGASAPLDYLIESIFYPNRKIKEGYHSIVIETHDDEEFAGHLIRETAEELVLRNVADQEVRIPVKDVKRRASGNSLMPSALIDHLPLRDQADLFRFLAELGKPGAYDASRGNVARLWKLRPVTHDMLQFNEDQFAATDLREDYWQPAPTLVDGRLLRQSMAPAFEAVPAVNVVGLYAGARFEVAQSGKVRLNISGAPISIIWINGRRVSANSEITADLESGAHTILLKLDNKNLPGHLRMESPDATFLVE